MAVTLSIRDESTAGETTAALTLDFLTEEITVRELIRSRVFQEVKDHNAGRRRAGPHLVQPSATEARLNAGGSPATRTIDWEAQYAVALEAFERGRVLVLVDDRQAESLDHPITIAPDTTVTFLRLVPLVGG